jgi:chorismate mutase
LIAIRGATTIKQNTTEEIKNASIELFTEIINANQLKLEHITAIFFSCTNDITKDYPGKFVRKHFNLDNTAIMHYNEMQVENSLKMCIRVLLLANVEHIDKIKYVYLNEAKKLREDLFEMKKA